MKKYSTGRTTRRKRWAAVSIVAAVILATLVSAAVGAPKRGQHATQASDTLVIARTTDIDQIDPHTATTFATIETLPLIYESLVRFDNKLVVQPSLARSWSFSRDKRTLTFRLRTGVRFADGKPFTSADVRASIRRILAPKTAAVAASNLASIRNVRTPNPTTVVLRLAYPNSPILAALADMNTAILSAADITANTIKRKANGTGPYQIASRTSGQSVTLSRNSRYWGARPRTPNVVFRVIPTEASIAAAVRSGAAHIGIVKNPVVARTVKSTRVRVVRQPSIDYRALMLNGRSGALRDARVRLAIACAINRKQVLATAALNEGRITGPITSPAFLSNPSERPCPTPNLARARQLLRAAGYASGITVKTIVPTGEDTIAVPTAQNLQAQLRRIGVNLELEILDTNAYVQRWLDEAFDAAVAFNTGRADPDTQYGRYFTSSGSLNKQGGIANKQLDSLFAKGRSASTLVQRKRIYRQLSRTLEQLAPWVWLYVGYNYYVVGADVRGFTSTPNGTLQYVTRTIVR